MVVGAAPDNTPPFPLISPANVRFVGTHLHFTGAPVRAVKEMDGGLRGDNHQAWGGQAFTIGSCCALDGLVGLLLCNLGFELHCHFLDGGWLGIALDCHLGGLHHFWCCALWSLCLGQGCNKLHGIMKDFARLPHGIIQDFARLPHGIIQDFATLPSIQDSIENLEQLREAAGGASTCLSLGEAGSGALVHGAAGHVGRGGLRGGLLYGLYVHDCQRRGALVNLNWSLFHIPQTEIHLVQGVAQPKHFGLGQHSANFVLQLNVDLEQPQVAHSKVQPVHLVTCCGQVMAPKHGQLQIPCFIEVLECFHHFDRLKLAIRRDLK